MTTAEASSVAATPSVEQLSQLFAAAIRSHVCLKPTERLYAIVDACQATELVDLARSRFRQPTRMLFKGAAASVKEVESFAPFFIPVDLETDFLEHWTAYLGKNAGILCVSSADPRKIFRHLRKIFVVQDEAGQEYFFRYYDPRVLRQYLPTCTEREAKEFFGPMRLLVCASEDHGAICGFTIGRDGFPSEARVTIGHPPPTLE